MKKAQTYNVIGKAELRNDGAEKVTGKALYTVDVDLPGMAHGKILRSPYAHARLARVDGSKAEMIAGSARGDHPRGSKKPAHVRRRVQRSNHRRRRQGALRRRSGGGGGGGRRSDGGASLGTDRSRVRRFARGDQYRRSPGGKRAAGARGAGQRRRAHGAALRNAEGV